MQPATQGRPADGIAVADFKTSVRTAQGGFFCSVGGKPDRVNDHLATLGEPAARAWRIDVAAAAPAAVGAVLPLFDNREGVPPRLLDVSGCSHLAVRLIGRLGERRVRIEIVARPSADLEAAGIPVAALNAKDLDEQRWSMHVFPLPEHLDRARAGSIRFTFDGPGPTWVAMESVQFCGSDGPAAIEPRKARPVADLRQAMWVWHTRQVLADARQQDELLAFCGKHGITDLFCQVPYDYADGSIRLDLVGEQRAFNAAAQRAGIRVHALDGAPEFVLRENHPRLFKLIDALDRLNREGPVEGRYRAVHMDNEPYILKDWKDPAARKRVLQQFIELNRELRRRANAAGMEYGVDIPFWWDSVDDSGKPVFVVPTETGDVPLLEALFACVQNAGIMSYRERVTGAGGVIACCLNEFELGARHGVKVFASVELGTGPRVEEGITFGVYPREYLRQQLETLRAALPYEEGCAGLAIHAYDFYRAMEEQP